MRVKWFGVRIIFIALGTIAGAIFLFQCQSRAAADKVFGHMTYVTDVPYIAEKATLVSGQCELQNNLLHYSLYYEGRYVYGDFNHDGLKDAAVVISGGEGATQDFRSLAFLINDGTQWVHRKSAPLGESVMIDSMKERDNHVIVDMLVHQKGDCHAGPTKRVRYLFDYGRPSMKVGRIPLTWKH